MNLVRVKKLNPNAKLPVYGSAEAAGADLYACLAEEIVIPAGGSAFIPTGLSMEIPVGYAGLIYARSGLACKQGLAPANKVGVIDSDYRGEFVVVLHNHGKEDRTVCNGDRIAQLVITPVLTVSFVETDELTDTVRAGGGFGSTGAR
jgi:dUTP pyrophosphatase